MDGDWWHGVIDLLVEREEYLEEAIECLTGLVVEPKEIEVGVIHRNRLVNIWLIPLFVNI